MPNSLKNVKEHLEERILKINRVSKVTKGGKTLNFRAIIVIGNKNGKVGVGIGKAKDVAFAIKKAKRQGQQNMIEINLTKYKSIPYTSNGNFGACAVILRPSRDGSGVVAGGAVRTILEVAGIKNIIAKQLGSNSILNNTRATMLALNSFTKKNVDEKNYLKI